MWSYQFLSDSVKWGDLVRPPVQYPYILVGEVCMLAYVLYALG